MPKADDDTIEVRCGFSVWGFCLFFNSLWGNKKENMKCETNTSKDLKF